MSERRYWIVSSNVRNDDQRRTYWRKRWQTLIIDQHVAFMGHWPTKTPKKPGDKMGNRFANEITPGDAVLITHGMNRELVALGRVAKTQIPKPRIPSDMLKHYKPVPYASYKRLERFKALDSDPARYRISFQGTTEFGRQAWALPN